MDSPGGMDGWAPGRLSSDAVRGRLRAETLDGASDGRGNAAGLPSGVGWRKAGVRRPADPYSVLPRPARVGVVLVLSLAGACAQTHSADPPELDEDSGASGEAAVKPEMPSSRKPDAAAASGADAAEEEQDGDRTVSSTEITGTVAVPPECSLPEDCVALEAGVLSGPACCRENTPCGYIISTTEQTLMDYPDAVETAETFWDDGCVPRSFVFSSQPGIDTRRVPAEEGEGGEEVLITEECEYRNFLAWPLPGCCTRDNECGVSTDEIYPVFQVLMEGESAPFTQQECVTAAELNQQLRDSKTLESLAFFPDTTGSCDYAALDAKLE